MSASKQGWSSRSAAMEAAATIMAEFISDMHTTDKTWAPRAVAPIPGTDAVAMAVNADEDSVVFSVREINRRSPMGLVFSGRWSVVQWASEFGADVAVHLPDGCRIELI